jgi:glycosyltransferase involved in cell wall biosynthesis
MTNSQSPLVSVLFITWKRFDLLKSTVESFIRNTSYPNLELVIADDGSGPETQAQIRTLPAQRFSLPEKHLGLGANNNNGIRLCTGKYIFMIQDDWQCHGPSDYLSNAIAVLEANPEVGIINFAGAPHPPDLNYQLKGSAEPCYLTTQTFHGNGKEEFLYTDQPHVQSRESIDHMGPYMEDRDMEKCESDYNFRWRDQKKFSTAVFPAYYMRVFSDEGLAQGRSHRLTKLRYRFSKFLEPIRPHMKKHAYPMFRLGKWTVQKTVSLLEALRIAR